MFDCVNDEAEHFCSTHNFNLPNSRFPELDQPFTVDEIKLSVKRLKRNKAYGSDYILNEYLIECIDILALHICDLFNAVLNSGHFPEKNGRNVL